MDENGSTDHIHTRQREPILGHNSAPTQSGTLRRLFAGDLDAHSDSSNLPALTAQAVITATYDQRHPDGPTRTDSPAQPSGLDQLLAPDEGARFVQFLESTTIRICVQCRLPKILECSLDCLSCSIGLVVPSLSLDQRRTLANEFIHLTTSCCNQQVCRTCCIGGLVRSIEHDWWFNLSGAWLSCPITSCGSQKQWQSTWHTEHLGLMTNYLQQLKDSDYSRHARLFERATRLRRFLWNMGRHGFEFVAGEDILRPKDELHRRLIQDGLVTDFFDLDIADNLGMIWFPRQPKVSPDGSTYQFHSIALAKHPALERMFSLKGRAATKECGICLEVMHCIFESTPEEDAQWGITMGGQSLLQTFISDRVKFPLRCWLPECAAKHPLHVVCCMCMRKHVKSSIDSKPVGKIPCPRLCGHVFTYEQIRCFTDPDTFTRYDRMLLNDALEKEDGFRWCLREGCQSGEIQCIAQPSPDDDDNRTLIKCSSCGFDMCYECRTSFHAGISCQTYRARKRIEENTAATEELLATMSKPCPRCGVAIQKHTGCQHMTCDICRFEFCWECLADWSLIWSINQRGRGSYSPTAHNEGCYFRNPNVPPPSAVNDGDVAEYRALDRGELDMDNEPLVAAALETLRAAAPPPRL